MNLEALDILTADVDNELDVGHKVLGGCKMSHSLDNSVIYGERVLDDVLAVACDRRGSNLDVGVNLIYLLKEALDKTDGVAL